jgi:O-succinylbenzoic acid--CoA ligase
VEGEKIPIDESIFEALDKYEKPKETVFVPEFKRTATGKVIRDQSIG